LAVAEAARNVACTGATPIAATNCLNFGNPEKPEVMWQFSEVIEGMAEACRVLEIPITGGNVSFYNETLGEGIYPTPVVGVVGLLDFEAEMKTPSSNEPVAMTPYFRRVGRVVMLVSDTPAADEASARVRFGSSEYARSILGAVWGKPPALDLKGEHALQQCIAAVIRGGWIESAHDISDGGFAVCLAECALARPVEAAESRLIGARVDLDTSQNTELALFDEAASRVLISLAHENVEAVRGLAAQYGVQASVIGETCESVIDISVGGRPSIHLSLSALRESWSQSFEHIVAGEAVAV
jgi:phosphoribosylformylglycinamidine synthase